MGAKIYNSALTKEIIEGARLQQNQGGIPSEIAEKVIPVMEVNPKLLVRNDIVKYRLDNNSAGGTIYTVPTDMEFYLTNVYMSLIKDVTATSILSTITAVIDGTSGSTVILAIPGLSLTPQTLTADVTFANPIKLAAGSVIASASTTNVANIRVTNIISGYLIKNSTA
jgi:hypothetical protein